MATLDGLLNEVINAMRGEIRCDDRPRIGFGVAAARDLEAFISGMEKLVGSAGRCACGRPSSLAGRQLPARILVIRELLVEFLSRTSTHVAASVESAVPAEVLTYNGDEFVDTVAAAEILGLGSDSVRWLLRNGHLEGRKDRRGQWLVNAASVENYAEQRARSQTRKAG